MDVNARRAAVAECLRTAERPVSATVLAQKFSVSRQVIVGDIALLRAGGMEIAATARGYLLPQAGGGLERVLACVHTAQETGRELEIMVDNGCTVVDVSVDHPVYGLLTGPQHLSTRYDLSQFLERLADGKARPLSCLTGGVHLHRLSCPDEAAFQRVREQLRQAGFLYEA